MNGHVFQCFDECSGKNEFARTVQALAEYIVKNLKQPGDMTSLTKSLTLPTIEVPEDLAENETSKFLLKVWEQQVTNYTIRLDLLRSNLKVVYTVIWGQCSEAMQVKLKTATNFKKMDDACNSVWLLKEIQAVMQQFEGQRFLHLALDEAKTKYYAYKQAYETPLATYIEEIMALVDVIEHYGGDLCSDPGLIAIAPGDTDEVKKKNARNKTLALSVLKRANDRRYAGLLVELENQYTRGLDQYPTDVTAAYGLLERYRTIPTHSKNTATGANNNNNNNSNGTSPSIITDAVAGLTFAQASAPPVAGTDGVTLPRITCFSCQSMGHYASHCPTQSGVQMFQVAPPAEPTEFAFTFANTSILIPSTWVLLDSQSTVSVFCNKAFLTNIRPSPTPLKVFTNGGTQLSTFIGDVQNFGTVWYNPHSLANIMSLAQVRRQCRVTMDTAVEPALHVHRQDGSTMTFREYASGLYYYDAAAARSESNSTSPLVTGYSFVLTVSGNKQRFHRREVEAADRARELYRKIGRPSQAQFEHILQQNLILNCPVTVEDAKRALLIYGADSATLKGKTTKGPSLHVPFLKPICLPEQIMHDHKDVTLSIDCFYVQGLPFLHTISRKLKFRTVLPLEKKTKACLLAGILAVLNMYQARGFDVITIHADIQFECLVNELLPIRLNLTAHDDHVGEVERSIRTIKERVRADVHSMPFNRLPRLLIIELVRRSILVLNQFPALDGVSTTLSPLTIMTGVPLPNYTSMPLEFGSYVQVFEMNDPTNTTKARTTGAITLNPTGNAQGSYHFMSLISGHRLSRMQWTVLPMPDNVIAAVEAMAAAQNQPLIEGGCPLFEWQPNHPVPEPPAPAPPMHVIAPAELVPHAYVHNPPNPIAPPVPDNNNPATDASVSDSSGVSPPSESGADTDEIETDDENADGDEDDSRAENDGNSEDNNNTPDEYPGDPAFSDDDDETPISNDGDVMEDDKPHNGDENTDAFWESGSEENEEPGASDGDILDSGAHCDDAVADYDEAIAQQSVPRYNLRSDRQRDYSHRLGHQMDNPPNTWSYDPQFQMLQHAATTLNEAPHDMCKYIFGHIMTQMSATAGIKKHGQKAVDALFKEFSQLDEKSVFAPLHAKDLTPKQRAQALRAINLIKEKRDGALKGRSCADGRPQKALYAKEDSASPTVSTDALMFSLMIDAFEERDVATADVVGAYLLADMDDFVVLKLTGESVDIMCSVNAKYNAFVVVEHGKKTLYLQLLKALYGCVKSALLWYELFSSTLTSMGFVLNPYDPCVANMMIDGAQCTIAWFVDDTKVSHISATVVSRVIEQIEEKFGKMTVTRGRKHVFLGMEIAFLDDGKLSIGMSDYVKNAIAAFQDDVSRSAVTPANKNIFEIDDEAPLLNKERSDRFHRVVAKLLYTSHRGRPDIQLAVAFLCTRVSRSTTQDWEKLKRLLQYLHGTVKDVLILGADCLTKLMTWVDAAYGVHHDMKSHTGGAMSLGWGTVMCKSTKQKLNTKSSTEAELVGASDYLPNTIWVKMFFRAQGYEFLETEFAQDNQSAIKLEKNGRASCGQKSRHIDVRYFFMKDRIKTEDITVTYCPTEAMLADFFTKPLQGSLFRKFRQVIMGYVHVSVLKAQLLSLAPVEERVGDQGKVNVSPGSNVLTSVQDKQTDEQNSQRKTYASVLKGDRSHGKDGKTVGFAVARRMNV